MIKPILYFIVGLIATFFLVGGIDYVVHPNYPTEWEESLIAPTIINSPVIPFVFICIGSVFCATFWVLLCGTSTEHSIDKK